MIGKKRWRLGGCYYKRCGMSLTLDDKAVANMMMDGRETLMAVVIHPLAGFGEKRFDLHRSEIDNQDEIDFAEWCIGYIKGWITGTIEQNGDSDE